MVSEQPEFSSSDRDDWSPCKPGTFPAPAFPLFKRVVKRKSDIVTLGLIYLSGAVVASAILFSWTSSSSPDRGSVYPTSELTCTEVHQHLGSYVEMSISNCQLRASISRHLARCQACDVEYQGMMGNHTCDHSGALSLKHR